MRRPQTTRLVNKNSQVEKNPYFVCPICQKTQDSCVSKYCNRCNIAIDDLLDLTIKQLEAEHLYAKVRYLQATVALAKVC